MLEPELKVGFQISFFTNAFFTSGYGLSGPRTLSLISRIVGLGRLDDAINLLLANEAPNSAALGQSDHDLISQFRRHLHSATFIYAGAYALPETSPTAEQIEAADGFINFTKPEKYRVMLQTRCLRTWFPIGADRNRLMSLLKERNMLLEGRQADTYARQLSLKLLSRKLPVYWLSLKGLGLTLEDLHVS
jgi:hypothetical protein